MYEIELKAHAADHAAVLERLREHCRYQGKVQKDDTYYHLPKGDGHITARIRLETSDGGTTCCLTYKRKELRYGADGAQVAGDAAGAADTGKAFAYEVNEEKECTLSDPDALETLLTDSGFTVCRRKHKTVYGFTADTSCGQAHLELCTVPPLGDFLEIEIMSPTNDAQTVARIRSELERLLTQQGIPLSAVEPRQYNEMLQKYAAQTETQ